MAVMTMPEAAVHKDDRPVFWEDDIRLARKIFCVEAIAEASSMQTVAYDQFRFRIFAANSRHHAAALLG